MTFTDKKAIAAMRERADRKKTRTVFTEVGRQLAAELIAGGHTTLGDLAVTIAPGKTKPKHNYRNQVKAHSFARAKRDFYIEPAWAVQGLLDVQKFSGIGQDPAAGTGTIPHVCNNRAGMTVRGYDLVPKSDFVEQRDFMGQDYLARPSDYIISNPPFKIAHAFIQRALTVARHKVAMLLPLTFLEAGAKDPLRSWLLDTAPLAAVHPFKHRVSMLPGEMEQEAEGGKKAFAWFVWSHDHVGPPVVVRILRGPPNG